MTKGRDGTGIDRQVGLQESSTEGERAVEGTRAVSGMSQGGLLLTVTYVDIRHHRYTE